MGRAPSCEPFDRERLRAARQMARELALDASSTSPAHLWALVTAYVCWGALLLLPAAFSISGGGPFAS